MLAFIQTAQGQRERKPVDPAVSAHQGTGFLIIRRKEKTYGLCFGQRQGGYFAGAGDEGNSIGHSQQVTAVVFYRQDGASVHERFRGCFQREKE